MKKILSLCLLCLCIFFSGCTDGKVVKDKKILNIGVGAELTTLYPLNMDEQNLSATRLCYEGLVYYDEEGVKPWLAESWEISEDGKAITFKLRENIKYHDGHDFNAESVKKNFEFKQKAPNFRAWPAITKCVSIDVIDDYNVKFNYDQAYFGYLLDFAFREIMVLVSPDVIIEDNIQFHDGVVGTGPYIYSQIEDGNYVKFIKNENYWGEKPYYDEIYVKYMPEASTRLLALKNGEVDIVYGNSLINWDDYKQAIDYDNVNGKISEKDSKTVYLVLNAGSSILNDLEVREAIAYGIDKKGICDGLTYGNQKPATDLFPAGNFLSDVDMNVNREYNFKKANRILDEAGWIKNTSTGIREKEGQKLEIRMTYFSGDAMNALLSKTLKSQMKTLGINLATEGQDMMTWWKDGVAGKYDMIIWATEENTSPQINFPKMLKSSPHTPSLNSLLDSESIFKAIELSQIAATKDEAKEKLEMVLNYCNDNIIEIPIYYVKDMILYNTEKVKDYKFTDTPIMFEIDGVVPKE